MNEEYTKQCCDRDSCCSPKPLKPPLLEPCNPCNPCNPCQEKNEWETWLPILVVLFLVCGGFSGLTGGGNDGCCDDKGGGSWIWILVLIGLFCFCNNQNDSRGGGLFGGLF